jgi:hypothetical protein
LDVPPLLITAAIIGIAAKAIAVIDSPKTSPFMTAGHLLTGATTAE